MCRQPLKPCQVQDQACLLVDKRLLLLQNQVRSGDESRHLTYTLITSRAKSSKTPGKAKAKGKKDDEEEEEEVAVLDVEAFTARHWDLNVARYPLLG